MRRITTAAAIVAGFMLTGCAATGIPEFDREQLASDRLDLPARYLEDNRFDVDSTRWLADHDGFDFYAARSTEGTCLILVREGDVENSLAGCSGGTELSVGGSEFPSMRFYIENPPTDVTESMIELTPNLYVMERVQK